MSKDGSLTGELDAAVLLRPTGRLEQDTCTDLRQRLGAIFAADVRDVVVDLRDVTSIDVAGVQVLAGASRHLTSRGGSLTVTHAEPRIARTLRINGEGGLVAKPSRKRVAARQSPAQAAAAQKAAPAASASAAVTKPVAAREPEGSRRVPQSADLRVVREAPQD